MRQFEVASVVLKTNILPVSSGTDNLSIVQLGKPGLTPYLPIVCKSRSSTRTKHVLHAT
jgi:hypothetical protein